jgi:hypothetical protein
MMHSYRLTPPERRITGKESRPGERLPQCDREGSQRDAYRRSKRQRTRPGTCHTTAVRGPGVRPSADTGWRTGYDIHLKWMS